MGDMIILGSQAAVYCYAPYFDCCYDPMDWPPPRGFRVRRRCDRWGRGTYLVPIWPAPRSLGTRQQCPVGSRRSVRELQIKSWI